MSNKRSSAVWDLSRATGNNRLVLAALADSADDDGYCWPGLPTIAKKTACEPRTVIRVIKRLEALGELHVKRGRGVGHPNRYLVIVGMDSAAIREAMKTRLKYSPEEIALAIAQIEEARGNVTNATSAPDPKRDNDDAGEDGNVTNATSKRDTDVTLSFTETPTEQKPSGNGEGGTRRRPRRADPQLNLDVQESPNDPDTGHDAPPGSAPPPPKDAPHPAVAIYREVAKRQPTKAQREELAERLAEGYDEATWRGVLATWRGAGWNLQRLDQILDRYERTLRGEIVDGAPPARRGRGTSTPPPPTAEVADVTALLAKERARQQKEAEMAAWHAERAAQGRTP